MLAVNHIRQEVNLRREVMEIGKKRSKTDGCPAKPKPALQKQRNKQATESDEELERLIMEGEEGR